MAEKSSLCKHQGSCLSNSLKGFVRGTVIGLGIRAVIAIVMGLVKRTLLKNPASILKMFAKENMKLVYFLGGMIGLHRSTLCLLRHYTNNEKISSFFAGFASGIPLIFEHPDNRMLFSMYLLVRAGDTICKYLVSQGLVPKIPKFIELVYIFSLSVLIYAGVFHPESTNKGFLGLMNRLVREPNDIVYIDMTGFRDKMLKRN